LRSGEVDWYEQVQTDLVPLLRRDPNIVIAASNPQGYIGGLRFNHMHPPFDNVRLRLAVQTAVNQEDYMRAIMGDDRSAWRVCRSQYPCGTAYGVEVDLPVQRGDIETAKRMVQVSGYSGQLAVIINPADFATIGPLGDEARRRWRLARPMQGRSGAKHRQPGATNPMTGTHSMRRRNLCQFGLIASLAPWAVPRAHAATDTLTIAYPYDVPSWDPTSATFVGAQSLYKAVFDSPLQYSPDLQLMPRLISEWRWQDQQKTRLEITLRRDVLFHDGSPLTTADVVFSIIDRPAKDPALLIRRILPPLKTVEVLSPEKAVVVFTNPSPAAPIYFGFLAGYFVPKAYIERAGEDGFKQHPIGAGPYKLVQYDRGSRIVLQAFDKYWAGEPKIKQVIYEIITDPTARVAAVESGRADLTIQVPTREMTRLGAMPALVAHAYPFSQVVMVLVPSYVPAMQDENVRRAMQMSIDKTAISKAFYGGVATPVSVLATPGTPGYIDGFTTPFDKTRAMELLKASGFTADNPVKFPFIVTNGAFPNDFDVARAIVAMWRAAGIQADIQEVSLAKYVDLSHGAALPGPALYSWANATGDPEDYTGRILDPVLPFSAWKEPAVGDRVHKLMSEPDDAARNAGWQALNKDATEHAWAIPLFQSVITMVYKKALHVVPYEDGYLMPAEYQWQS
jgi:peptide/nickel transport system substrate-binding protein